MAAQLIKKDSTSFSVDQDGKGTLKVIYQVEGDSLADIVKSTDVFPKLNSEHDEIQGVYLNSVDISPNGNLDRKVQALATLTYGEKADEHTAGGSGGEPGTTYHTGITSINISYNESTRPLMEAYAANGKKYQLLNSAGCRIEAETTEMIMNLTVNYRTHNLPQLLTNPIINKTDEKIAGFTVSAYTGKLMPISVSYSTEDEVSFYECSLQVLVHPRSWEIQFLNVGTMCYWKDSSGNIIKQPANIYRYTPWTSAEMTDNMKIQPKYGSIDDVIAAQKAYWNAVGDKNEKIPYEEVTEPMPLERDGTLRLSSIQAGIDPDDDNNGSQTLSPYLVYRRFDCPVGDWPSDIPTSLTWLGSSTT